MPRASHSDCRAIITEATPAAFAKFRAEYPYRGAIRLHSEGGSLRAGLQLGEMIRSGGYVTEVGSDEPATWDKRFTERTAGICASACAYAFLGGVSRSIEDGSRIGFHRFYYAAALKTPTDALFSAVDLDQTQRTTAAIGLYILKMGGDGRLLAVADEAGPGSMRWLSPEEIQSLNVAYDPDEWKPWRVEPYRGGALAISETRDGNSRMIASCSRKRGPQVLLSAKGDWVAQWFEQCRAEPFEQTHPIFGERVHPSQAEVIRSQDGGATIRFRLPNVTPKLTSPEFFGYETREYSGACTSPQFKGTRENFVPSVRLALKNCFTD